MKARLVASELLRKCGLLWSQLAEEIEEFNLHLITTTYRYSVSGSVKYEFWLVFLTMVRVIWRYMRKFRVQA